MIKKTFHEKLLSKVKDIFGDDIVENCFIVDEIYDGFKTESSAKYLELKDDYFSYDTMTIVIIFKNGKQVTFANSEWAHIGTFKE